MIETGNDSNPLLAFLVGEFLALAFGISWIGALLVVVACPLHDRATDEQIVNGRPLSPW